MKNSLELDENKFSEIYEDKKVSQFNPLYSKEGYKKIIKTIIANKNNIEKDITNLINNGKKKEKGNDSSKQTLIDIIFYLSEKKWVVIKINFFNVISLFIWFKYKVSNYEYCYGLII